MATPQEIEKLKADGKYFDAGWHAGRSGLSPHYGCHYGMRSTREWAQREFKCGFEAAGCLPQPTPEAMDNVFRYNAELNAMELAPNGDDYNAILNLLQGSPYQSPHVKGADGFAEGLFRPSTKPQNRIAAMTPEIATLIDRGALFVVNHSAGKNSQAMLIVLRRYVPAAQLLVIHADLDEVEWDGNVEHIEAAIDGLPLIVCRNENKTFLSMVEDRGMWPSAGQRQCTSDLKRGPIEREIRRYLKSHPEFGGLVVNCMGIRAAESPARAKQTPFRFNERNSINGREWYDWLPIFAMSTCDVFREIAGAGQEPHPAYPAGMTRLSCVFCIMASRADLLTAASLKPDLYARYVEIERRIGHTLSMDGRPLEEVTGIYLGAKPPPTSAAKCPCFNRHPKETDMHNASDFGFSIAGQLPAAEARLCPLSRYERENRAKGNHANANRLRDERIMATALIAACLKRGLSISVWDGEAFTLKHSTNKLHILERLATADDDAIVINHPERGRIGSFLLIYGNSGAELIADHADNPTCNEILDKLEPVRNRLER